MKTGDYSHKGLVLTIFAFILAIPVIFTSSSFSIISVIFVVLTRSHNEQRDTCFFVLVILTHIFKRKNSHGL